MRTDLHVVADLDLVVELDAFVNHGVIDGTAINRGVGADQRQRPRERRRAAAL